MKYFAYGSNMSVCRIRERVPSARPVGVHQLVSHELRFHKVGRDGSAKCDAFFTGSNAHVLEGVLFEIESTEIARLDRAEGYGYEQQAVQVFDCLGERVEAFTYKATIVDESLLPFLWYKHHVLAGARSAGLSSGHIAGIERIKAISDPDATRERIEFAIYERWDLDAAG